LSTGFTTVYGPQTYTHTDSGWQIINFATPYEWDGVSNIVVEISHEGANLTNSAETYYTETNDNTVIFDTSIDSEEGSLSNVRPNIKIFSACVSARVAVVATIDSPPALTLSD